VGPLLQEEKQMSRMQSCISAREKKPRETPLEKGKARARAGRIITARIGGRKEKKKTPFCRASEKTRRKPLKPRGPRSRRGDIFYDKKKKALVSGQNPTLPEVGQTLLVPPGKRKEITLGFRKEEGTRHKERAPGNCCGTKS